MGKLSLFTACQSWMDVQNEACHARLRASCSAIDSPRYGDGFRCWAAKLFSQTLLEVDMGFRKLAEGLLLLLASLMAGASERPLPKPDWLVGNWVLCEDPDNSPKDTLQFNSDGTGLVIRAKGNIEFLHKHSGQSVSLLASANGYVIPIELSSSSSFDKLLLHSKRTGNVATYVRSDSTQASSCGIK